MAGILGIVQIAQRIGREVAKLGHGPLDILQDSLAVVGRRQPQIFFHFLLPQLGKIFDLYFAIKNISPSS